MAVESLYTTTESQNLDTLYQDYLKKKDAYDIEASQNAVGHQYESQGFWMKPPNVRTDEQDFRFWLGNSDVSLAVKKSAMETAKADYVAEVNRLETKYQQTMAITQPEVYIATQTASINAASQEKIAEDKANYMSKNAKYIVIAVVVLAIVGTVLYFKFRKKAA